jgi:hypothetical protein
MADRAEAREIGSVFIAKASGSVMGPRCPFRRRSRGNGTAAFGTLRGRP